MNSPKYIIGIDLGTTHSVMAYTRADLAEGEGLPDIEIFSVPQVVSPGEIQALPLLPSFLLLPGPHDVPEGSLRLPWPGERQGERCVGQFARKRGAELPQRLVSSAKSWLCHSGVNRREAILPWKGTEDRTGEGQRVSPVDVSTCFLEHLRDAWNYEMAADDEESRLERQDIYLTVPASFDAVARELTVQATRSAGLENFTLLEEPQAAFYSWIEAQKDQWRHGINVGETILVCDIGGGTTDFSLIQVSEEKGELALKRIAVGDHILLGGDNMDLTLAYSVQAALAQKKIKLDTWQFQGLWHSCRTAKERLLSRAEVQAEPITILGRGTSLIGNTIRAELTRQQAEAILLEGFFPSCSASEFPREEAKVGIREMGLPYEADPGITRHLAKFLSRQTGQEATDGAVAFPSAVLFNGGVMKSGLIRERMLQVISGWSREHNLRELPGLDLDLAVARGAAYYGLARGGRGIRIRAGTARSYYIGIESSMPAVPGVPTPIKALAVVPFGMEEGTEVEIHEKEFGLVLGETAVFKLLASTVRKKDLAGDEVEDWTGEIEEISTMEMMLPLPEGQQEEQAGGGSGKIIPVWLESRVTEVGTLELWCVSVKDRKRWKLEFDLKEREEG